MFSLLKKLCLLDGISGNEDAVRSFIIGQIRPFVDDLRIDALGNLIALKKGKKRAPKLMLAAHMDEVGFILEKIEEDGALRFFPVGGIDPRVCLGHKVRVGEKKIPGIVGLKAIHLVRREERQSVPEFPQMYIDIGVFSKSEASELVDIGDFISFDSDYLEFGEGMVKAKALDDRLGCTVLIDLIKEELPTDVTFVFSAMEEVGGAAKAAAYAVKPDIALVIEASGSADISTIDGQKKVSLIGAGPVVYTGDRESVYDRDLYDDICRIARENNIPCQTKRMSFGGTDAGAIQIAGEGVRVAAIAPPIRYSHTAAGVVKKKDVINCEKLARAFIEAVACGEAGERKV